jgi:hypothetical protein
MGVGALSGAAIDAGIQVASNLINGKKWNDIDYGSVATSAAIGAILGPIGGRVANFAKCGKEIKIGKNFRFAPFGNRTGHPIGKYPHYHRRGLQPGGGTKPGQGIGRHRPWEKKSTDTSWKDRF